MGDKEFLYSDKPSLLYDDSSPDWVPSLHLGGAPELESTSLASAADRYQRAVQRRVKRRIIDDCDALSRVHVANSVLILAYGH